MYSYHVHHTGTNDVPTFLTLQHYGGPKLVEPNIARLITVFQRDGKGRDGKTTVKMVPPSRPVPPTNSMTAVTYRPVPLIKSLPFKITFPSRR